MSDGDVFEIRPQARQGIFLSHPADVVIFGGAAGGGKMLEVSELIPTPCGWRTIGSLRVGDAVFGRDGRPYSVTTVSERKTAPAWRLVFDDGTDIVANDEHLWLTFDAKELAGLTRLDPEWRARRRQGRKSRSTGSRGALVTRLVTERNRSKQHRTKPAPTGTIRTTEQIVQTLKVGNRANHAVPVAAPLEMPAVDLPLDPYLLGVWLGDGTSSTGDVTSQDVEIFDAFRSAGWVVSEAHANLRPNKSENRNVYGLRAVLRSLGVLNNKRVPSKYLWASRAQRLALLQGLMDTDGGNDGSGVSFSNMNWGLADAVRHLAVSLGNKASVREKPVYCDGKYCGIAYVVKFTPNVCVFRLTYKRGAQKIAKRRTTRFRYIVAAERVPSAEMCCIGIDAPDHLYLASEAMVPTHNTFSILIEPIRHIKNPEFKAVVFRRTFPLIMKPGGIWDDSKKVYPHIGGVPLLNPPRWTFPTGATVSFQHLNNDEAVYEYKSAQIPLIMWDQLEEFSETQWWYLFSRNRSTCGVHPYIRATCLSGDTVVTAEDGSLVPLAECMQGDSLLSPRIAYGDVVPDRVSAAFTRTVSGLRITTRHEELTASGDHRFYKWTSTGVAEALASELKVGDWIASVRRLPHGTLTVCNDEAYLAGYTAGDGGVTGRPTIRRLLWTDGDRDHAEYIAGIASSYLKTKIGIHRRKSSNAFAVYTTTATAETDEFILRHKCSLGSANTRAFSQAITCGDEDAARAILQGAFDAEGTVGQDRIAIAVVSPAFISQVAVLLRRFGIIGRFDASDRRPPRKRVYRLTLRGAHAVAFVNQVGFRSKTKQAAAAMLVDRIRDPKRGICCGDADMVPISRPSIRHLRRLFGKSWWNKNRAIRRETADAVIAAAEASWIDPGALAMWSRFSWSRIAKVSRVDSFVAYDVTMPAEHTFLAGCVVSHNCNPDADSWLATFLAWWIDQDTGYPITERAGKTRWMARDGDTIVWGNTRDDVVAKVGPDTLPKSVSFVPSLLDDNPALLAKDPGYRANIQMLTTVERERLEKGNWKIRPKAGLVFPRDKWRFCAVAPADTRWCRYYDKAATEGGGGARTAGVLVGISGSGAKAQVYIGDAVAGRWGDLEREDVIKATAEADRARFAWKVTTSMEEEGGSGGKDSANATIRNLAGHVVKSHRKRTAKHLAWKPLASQQQAGNVWIVTGVSDAGLVGDQRALWDFSDFVRELDALAGDPDQDAKKLKDLADAASGAYNELTGGALMDRDLICSGEYDEADRSGYNRRKPLTEAEVNDLPDDIASVIRDLRTSEPRSGRGRDWDE